MATSTAATRSGATAARETQSSMGLRPHIPSPDYALARSVALTTAGLSEAFPLVGNPASEGVSTVAVSVGAASMEVVVAVGNHVYPCTESVKNLRTEGNTMLQKISILAQIERKIVIRF